MVGGNGTEVCSYQGDDLRLRLRAGGGWPIVRGVDLRQKTAISVVWSAFQLYGQQVLQFVVLVVLVRLLSQEDFGLVAMALAILQFLSVFLQVGVIEAIVQKPTVTAKTYATAFWVQMSIAGLAAGLLFLGHTWIAQLLGDPRLELLMMIFAGLLMVNAVSGIATAKLRREFQFKRIAFAALSGQLLGAIVAVVLASMGFGYWALVGQTLVAGVVQTGMLWFHSGVVPWSGFNPTEARELFQFSWKLTLAGFMNRFNVNFQDLLIGGVLGPASLGLYNVGARAARLTNRVFVGVVETVALPALSRIQEDQEKLKRVVLRAQGLMALIAMPCFAMTAVLSGPLVDFLFGERWAMSASITQLLALAYMVHAVQMPAQRAVVARGAAGWLLFIKVTAAVTNVIAFVLFVQFGIVAVALVYLVRAYVMLPVPVYVIRRVVGLRFSEMFTAVHRPLAAMLLAVVPVWCLLTFGVASQAAWVQLIAGGALGILIYVAAAMVLCRSEIGELLTMVKSVRGRKGSGESKEQAGDIE